MQIYINFALVNSGTRAGTIALVMHKLRHAPRGEGVKSSVKILTKISVDSYKKRDKGEGGGQKI